MAGHGHDLRPRPRSARNARVARRDARRSGGRRARARARADRRTRRRSAARRRARFAGLRDAVRQHDSGRPTSRRCPATANSKRGCATTCAGTRWRWSCARTRSSSELGGHVASFASAATLYDVGFNHFFRAPSETFGGDLVFFQGHSSPGVYARAFLEGRITRGPARTLPPRSRRQGPRRRIRIRGSCRTSGSSRPSRWASARSCRSTKRASCATCTIAGCVDTTRPQGVGVHRRRRDRRARIARRDLAGRARETRQPHLGRQLQPAAARRPGARQRQDHSRARRRLQRRRLERHQGDLGQQLGPAARGRHDRPARRS